ncbi:E3 ubiquitin-protein ligase SlrP-like [Chrysoperla carnea]|uniref:E3 ubiquitin-protein ligase SlrP-like n=1 Tax=Chrysoperla carnea TaxID=189513 RepID=UPI001D08EE99|nr:E3 ubiquitin-protein ligase SlrP-like [Chrysoperla carnea]
MIPDYLEEFKVWELWELPDDEEFYTFELQPDCEEESEIKLKVDESVLNAWELWKKADDQGENESRGEAFEELKNCGEYLSLGYLSLTTMPNVYPYGLKELHLADNKLTQIPDNLPETLEILNMDCNQVCIISEKLPSNLRELLLPRNQIISIPETLPDSITRLNLYENTIDVLPKKLPNSLKRLDVCGNQLTSLPENLPETLEELEIGSNKLTCLPNNLPKSLRSIFADNNEIKFLPKTLPEMLNEISIRCNQLTCLPEQLPKSLERLYMSSNKITEPKFDFESIIELDIENNGIETIPEDNFNLPKLQKLFVSDNKLKMLPKNLPETLECLYACNNEFTEILTDLPKSLRNLDLDGNNITTLSAKLPPNLERLSLNFNKFTEIPTELPESLDSLCLSNNLIAEVSSNIENIPNATIYLEENPLSETSLEYLRQLIRTTSRQNVWFDGSHEYYVNFVETRPLIEEIPNWLDTELIHPYWSTISEEITTRPFSRLLYRIRQTPNFEVAQFKEDMSKWLCLLGEDNNSKQKLREKIFLVAAEANESCDHRVGWSLNQMKILSIAQEVELGKYDNKMDELIRLARGMYRLNILDQISRQTVRNLENACDEIEIYLEYQIRLREVFDLPIGTSKMNEHYSFVLPDEDIERAVKEIVNKERIEFIDYLLLDWQPWKEVLKRWNYDQFVKCENDIRNEEFFKQTLDKRKMEYLLETNMSDELPLDVEIQLGSQVQRQIEKDIWLKLTNEFLESKNLGNIERL